MVETYSPVPTPAADNIAHLQYIVDPETGKVAGVDANGRLKVALGATPTIDIGDVDLVASGVAMAALQAILSAVGGYMVQVGASEQIPGDDASHTLTIPAGATHIRLVSSGGACYWRANAAAADATEAPLFSGAVELLAVKQGASDVRVYVPTGATFTATYLQQTART